METIKEKHIPKDNLVGFLHVRRGDLKDACNTTIAKMEEYLSCSFHNTTTGGRNITMLMASDEEDPVYRQELAKLFERIPSVSNVVQNVVDIDQTVLQVLEAGIAERRLPERLRNNFFIFEVGHSLRRRVTSFRVAREHNSCQDCKPLREKLLQLS